MAGGERSLYGATARLSVFRESRLGRGEILLDQHEQTEVRRFFSPDGAQMGLRLYVIEAEGRERSLSALARQLVSRP